MEDIDSGAGKESCSRQDEAQSREPHAPQWWKVERQCRPTN